MAGASESAAGYDQDAILSEGGGELHVVIDGGLGEHVERALGLDDLVADVGQCAMHEVALGLVGSHVYRHRLEVLDDVLHECGGVDEAERAVAEGESVYELFLVGVSGLTAMNPMRSPGRARSLEWDVATTLRGWCSKM